MAKPMTSLTQRDIVVDNWLIVLLKLTNLKSCEKEKKKKKKLKRQGRQFLNRISLHSFA